MKSKKISEVLLFSFIVIFVFFCASSNAIKAQVVYSENFDDWSADDQTGPPAVCWGGNYYIASSSGTPLCMNLLSMRINSTTEKPVIGIDLRGYTNASISYTYYQYAYAYCAGEIKTQTSGDLDCDQSFGFTTTQYHFTEQQCVDVTIPLTDDAINYFRWSKSGGAEIGFWIDEVVVQAIGQGPQCVDSFDETFGTSFQSGSVCSIWPDMWETCEGNGPYITSGGPCGGSYDYAMYFGDGWPYSSGETVCIDLIGAAAPSLKYYYSWDGLSTVSPIIEISLDHGDTWSELVSSHENTGGSCLERCINLNAYIGFQIKLRFTSQSSTSDYHAYFDDIRVHRNDPCPQNTATPTFTPEPLPTHTPTRSPTETATPEPTEPPTATPTFSPTNIPPTDSPTPSPTNSPTQTPTDTPIPTFTTEPTGPPTGTPIPTEAPTVVSTETPTSVPTSTSTIPPTDSPTSTPTEFPTDPPTEIPTEIPSPSPTQTMTPIMTETPETTPTTTVSPTPPPIPATTTTGCLILTIMLGSLAIYGNMKMKK